MLVAIPLDGEEGVHKRLRESEFYKGNFGEEYFSRYTEMQRVVEAAKMYIVDNFPKIKDWAELDFNLVGHYSEKEGQKRTYFGMKNAERDKRYPPKPRPQAREGKKKLTSERMPRLVEALKRMDDQRIQVKIFDAVYDWTDGDFSITVNDKPYLWIDHQNPDAVIQIACFIEKQLKNAEQAS